jgi:hypothetical protein
MTLAVQPDMLPTNKLLAFAVMTLVLHYASAALPPPEILDAWMILIDVGLPLVVAWFVPDRPNIPVE